MGCYTKRGVMTRAKPLGGIPPARLILATDFCQAVNAVTGRLALKCAVGSSVGDSSSGWSGRRVADV